MYLHFCGNAESRWRHVREILNFDITWFYNAEHKTTNQTRHIGDVRFVYISYGLPQSEHDTRDVYNHETMILRLLRTVWPPAEKRRPPPL